MADEWLRADQVAALGHAIDACAAQGGRPPRLLAEVLLAAPALVLQDGRWRALVGELLAAYCTWLVAEVDAGCDVPMQGSPRLLAACKAAEAALDGVTPP